MDKKKLSKVDQTSTSLEKDQNEDIRTETDYRDENTLETNEENLKEEK